MRSSEVSTRNNCPKSRQKASVCYYIITETINPFLVYQLQYDLNTEW